MSDILKDRLNDHRKWVLELNKVFFYQLDSRAEMDPGKCALGKFLNSEEYREYSERFPEFAAVMNEVHDPHQALHASAGKIRQALQSGNVLGAVYVYTSETLPLLNELERIFAKAIALEKGN